MSSKTGRGFNMSTKTISVTISEETYKDLEKIAKDNDSSLKDVLRHALGLELHWSSIQNDPEAFLAAVRSDYWYKVVFPYDIKEV